MSGEGPPDDDGPEPAPRISMAAGETFDGQERWFSRAAFNLHTSATGHSASCGHPGFVPNDYLEQLESPGTETTATAAELCTLGTWERVDGGYRVLDWEAVGYALDGVCQRRQGEDPKALAGERDHETKAWALLAKPVIITPLCPVCGIVSARVETVAPGQMPAEWDKLPGFIQAGIRQAREPGKWHLITAGPAAGNSHGIPIDAVRAGQIAWALRPPLRFAQVHQAGLHDDAGFCAHCDAAYCYYHWNAIDSGYGFCPRGHGKSLDPDW
jgi:hypothetical protein